MRLFLDWQASDDLDLKLTAFHVDADNGYDAFSLDNTRHTLSDTLGMIARKLRRGIAEQLAGRINFELVSLLSLPTMILNMVMMKTGLSRYMHWSTL